ncbi:MAG: L-histidine N(alpha)-methyltransferase [Bacteroidia bacterium]
MAIQRDKTSEVIDSAFAQDVFDGLSANPKTLSSKYFYDDEGSRLFERIMQLPEYYLTNAETEILEYKGHPLCKLLGWDMETPIEIIELGAGDGNKIKYFLDFLEKCGYDFIYRPVDISAEAVKHLVDNLDDFDDGALVDVRIEPIICDYAQINDFLGQSKRIRWMFFLGSNLGNMENQQAKEFLKMITKTLRFGDKLMLGLDKAKNPEVILKAYNDSKGVTAAFNLNLLKRINTELGANFNLEQFKHSPVYNTELKRAESYIESLCDQEVYVEALDATFHFAKGEKLKTEISQKYDDAILNEITTSLGLKHLGKVEDHKQRFMDVVFEIE